ncbi:Acetoacetate decarboxylase [Gloeothece citriformis PCC 7424]|uniref:Acetoacetate decarboxylase n=1 Tax=Gloeothece citriformis (strain PCC 7424) TaxID=65393 RepID=B7KG07_GLOC7|nr:acetoacetate decarboxylase family protein [Gloeothece citriformis]ACK69200.1 Acetoacetate decarboxylase [Gloeothece citriformis PCC 7424]
MSYPSAPWTLQGYAFQTLHLLDSDKSRGFIPPELEIVSVLPGKTLGGVYFSAYQSGSILEYNELIVVPALVNYQGKIGVWISHIYVDNEESVAGGREIWGLPKQMAEFIWDKNEVNIYQNNRKLCNFRYQQGFFNLSTGWRQPLMATSFGGLNTNLLFFTSTAKSHIGLVEGQLEIPDNSPFSQLQLSQHIVSLKLSELTLTVNPPRVVGKKSVLTSIT